MKVNSQEKIINDNAELLVIKHQIVDSSAKLVFTNGCFDILHAGHIDYIEKAAQLGDVLIIGVNDDESVKRLKGDSRPINSLEQRMKVLAALEAVDFVIPFTEDTPLTLIEAIIPDVLVKGGDYTIETMVGANFVMENGGTVEIIPFVENTSTTDILSKINTL